MSDQPNAAMPPSSRPAAPGRAGSTLGRGLAVLAAVAERGEVRAGEVAAAVGLPVSTVYRYLRLLREHGFVVDRDGVYRCGPRLLCVSARRDEYSGLAATAEPLMARLTQLTGETVTLAVRIGASHALCVHQTESPNAERSGFSIGQTLPLHAGAGERVLLAFAPREVIQLALVGELEQFTANTPCGEDLRRKIASTRSSWITTSRAEYVPGVLAIAVPVAVDRQVICSLTVSGPTARCDAGWQARVKPLLSTAGRALAHLLREAAHGADRLPAAPARPARPALPV